MLLLSQFHLWVERCPVCDICVRSEVCDRLISAKSKWSFNSSKVFFFCTSKKKTRSQPSIRGTLLSMTPLARNSGQLLVFLLGSFLSWRQVSFTCAGLPVIIVTAIYFVICNWTLNHFRIELLTFYWLRICFFLFLIRFPNHRIGCCQRIAWKMHKNHCNGCAVGCPLIWFVRNLHGSKVIAHYRIMSHFGINYGNCGDNVHWNHLFWPLHWIFCWNFRSLWFGALISFKCWRRMECHGMPIL